MTKTNERLLVAFLTVGTFVVLYLILASCASLKRTGWVGAGAGGGAAVGSLAGPGGAIGGAVVGGAVSSAIVDSDLAQERATQIEDRFYPGARIGNAPYEPQPSGPWSFLGIAWWQWLLGAYWVYSRRAHLLDAITKKGSRWNEILRAFGIRTHRTPIK